jgi:hypothetical protein
MRTTLTIDDDIASKLKTEMQKQSGKSFKDVVNETLRRGLLAKKEAAKNKPFKLKTYSLKPLKNVNFDNIGELLEQIEGADFK